MLAVSLTVDVSQVWMYIVGDSDRRARFLACNSSLKSFQIVVIKFVHVITKEAITRHVTVDTCQWKSYSHS